MVVILKTTMMQLSNELVESLKTLGLTEYEAKVYAALVLFGMTEVKQVYEYLNAPKPSVYQSLKTLMDKGLVQVVSAKPAIYKATPPEIAIRHMTEIHRKAEAAALQELEELEQHRVEQQLPDVLWTLYGDENIEHTIEELLGKVQNSVKFILPDTHLRYLEMLRDRDVSVELITFGTDTSLPERYGLKHLIMRDALGLDATDLIPLVKNARLPQIPPDNWTKFLFVMIDDEEFVYIPPFPAQTRSGMTSRNPFVIALATLLLDVFSERMPVTYPGRHKPGHQV